MTAPRTIQVLFLAVLTTSTAYAQRVPLPVQEEREETTIREHPDRVDVVWPDVPDLADPSVLRGSTIPDVRQPLYIQRFSGEKAQIFSSPGTPPSPPAERVETGQLLKPAPAVSTHAAPAPPLPEPEMLDTREERVAAKSALKAAMAAHPPVGTDDLYKALADQPRVVAAPGFLMNDIDLDGESLTATVIVDNVDNGTLVAFADGSFTYTPDAGFIGTDSFVYRMRNESLVDSEPVTVTIDVVEGNRAPLGTEDVYGALAGTALSVSAPGFLANDIDPDGEALTATAIVDNVDNGSLVAFADGSFTYTPDPGFTGTDSFVYRIRDASLNDSEPVTVTINVIEGNRAPIGIDDSFAAVENTPLSIAAPGFLGNDLDPDGEALTATAIVDNVDNGSLVAFADGSFTYTPDPGFTGTDSFVYRMRDASLNDSEPVTVQIDVLPAAGTTPVGISDAYVAVADQPHAVAAPGFLMNDIDLNGEALTATVIVDNVDNGTLVAFANGSFTYTPDPGFIGTDSFVYRMRNASLVDSEPVTVTIDVVEGNRAPIGMEDAYAARSGAPLSIAAPGFLANDIDPDGEALTATVIVDNVDNGALVAFADGSFTYTPDPGFTGTDSFVYRMRDASLNDSEPVTVTINVIEGNRPPLGTDDVFAVVMETPLSIAAPGFLANDIDPDGESLTATVIVDNVDNGALVAFADGSFTYTPDPGFIGTDSFVYRMRDASLNDSEPVTVQLNVLSKNQPPVADAGDDQTVDCTSSGGTEVTLDGTGSSDPDGDPLTFTWTGPFSEGGGVVTGSNPTVTLPLGAHTITLTVDDGNGGTDSDDVEITVVDDAPPVIVVNSPPLVLWPPSGAFHHVNLDDLDIEVHDCDESLSSADVVITQVTSDEAQTTHGRRRMAEPDILINTSSCRSMDLRAERQGSGNGRVYSARLEVMDSSGNVGWATYEVHVPHDKRPGSTAIADEPAFSVVAEQCEPASQGASAVAEAALEDQATDGIEQQLGELPREYALAQNHPNPFNPTTTITFTMPESGHVRLSVFNMLGQEVVRLVDGMRDGGVHEVRLDASSLPSAMYVYSITAGSFQASRTMVLLK